jgi:Tyrosine phosphatase family
LVQIEDDTNGIMNQDSGTIGASNEKRNTECLIRNFRRIQGLKHSNDSVVFYRCAKTDDLADLFINSKSISSSSSSSCSLPDGLSLTEAEQCLLYDAGLIIDLRSSKKNETNIPKAQLWMENAPGGSIHYCYNCSSSLEGCNKCLSDYTRILLQLDVLQYSTAFRNYNETHWLTKHQIMQVRMFRTMKNNIALNHLLIDCMNLHGLAGINEAILEVGKKQFLLALQTITQYLEKIHINNDVNDSGSDNEQKKVTAIVCHCVQGKDRTGLMAMLLQSIVDVPDEIIINDYHLSEHYLRHEQQQQNDQVPDFPPTGIAAVVTSKDFELDGTSTAVNDNNNNFNRHNTTKNNPMYGHSIKKELDTVIVYGSPKQVMIDTLSYVRKRYGSISPGYMNNIGFTEIWRTRFLRHVRLVHDETEEDITMIGPKRRITTSAHTGTTIMQTRNKL